MYLLKIDCNDRREGRSCRKKMGHQPRVFSAVESKKKIPLKGDKKFKRSIKPTIYTPVYPGILKVRLKSIGDCIQKLNSCF